MRKQQDLIVAHFEKLKLPVRKQSFEAKQATVKDPIPMTNLIVSVFPERKKRAIICSHYDTRPIADQEPDPRKWREPFVSANDGGSGVAFCMEFAHHLADMKLEVGLDFVLFDGEEVIYDRDRDKYFLGSEHFAREWKAQADRPLYLGAVLLDMIAGKTPRFPAEDHSIVEAPALTKQIWRIAGDLKCASFQNQIGPRVLDDHLALQKVGIPAIDIIDFDYPHWHRLADQPKNCNPEGPSDVAKVLSVWLQRLR
jgi:Zn-dependent M28 family amino/carboxypeptidase